MLPRPPRLLLVLPPLLLLGACQEGGRSDGEALYARYCASCHRADGQGQRAVFPPLKGHAAELAATPEGRRRLIQTPLHGRQGPLLVDGVRYDGLMVPTRSLRDEDLAAILNHVLASWGNDKLLPAGHESIQASEVALWRDQPPLP
jgi:mono/diheme cytochrome c family protein